MVRIFLIRHGQTVWNHSGRYQGITDVELSDVGRQQAQTLIPYFREIAVDAVYASDLSRAYDTALPLAESKGLPVTKVPGLREINFGDWEGLTYEEITRQWPGAIEHMYQHPDTLRISRGESFLDVQVRAYEALQRILSNHDDGTLAIVSHGGTIRCLLCSLLGIDLHLAWNFKQDNANVTEVHYYGERNLLALLNDTHHVLSV